MISRIHGKVAFTCDGDGCSESLETGKAEFSDAILQFKNDGWRASKEDGEWVHYCSGCK